MTLPGRWRKEARGHSENVKTGVRDEKSAGGHRRVLLTAPVHRPLRKEKGKTDVSDSVCGLERRYDPPPS